MNVLEADPCVYPESDGQPMAESTEQYEHIVLLRENLNVMFRDRPDVLVAADNLIYPVKGDTDICIAPDVYVAIGVDKGPRGCYKVWEENNIFPQVVFEVISPSNTTKQMKAKREFYEIHGAVEYYVIDLESDQLFGYTRRAGRLVPVSVMDGYTSPLLGMRFELVGDEFAFFMPDGSRFQSMNELVDANIHERRLRQLAEVERKISDAARAKAEADHAIAEAARTQAEAEQAKAVAARILAEDGRSELEAARAKVEAENIKLRGILKVLGVDPDA